MQRFLMTDRLPVAKHYRTEDGTHIFTFHFVAEDDHIAIFCPRHPDLDGQDPSVHKTHLFDSGKICFIAGMEPQDLPNALRLAKQWAEYFLEYCRTGVSQS